MAVEKTGLLVDAAINLTGISSESIGVVKKSISDSILSDNKIKLTFDKNGKSALLNELEVVYDRVHDIQKIAASVKIGNTNYKFFIDDYSKQREEVLKINRAIDGQNRQILNIRKKGLDITDKDKEKLEKLNKELEENIKNRNKLAQPLIRDNSITGDSKYRASNLRGAVNTKTVSKTGFVNDEKLITEQYAKQASLIKEITKANKSNAQYEKSVLESKLKSLKEETKLTENRLKNKYQGNDIYKNIVSTAKSQTDSAITDFKISEESKTVQDRVKSLDKYMAKLKEIEKIEKNLAYAREKYNASAKNRSEEALQSIKLNEEHLTELKGQANTLMNKTNVKYKGEKFQGGKTSEYNEALKQQQIHLHNVKNAQAEATAAYSKSNNILGIMNENFKQAAARIIDYTIVYRGLWMIIQKVNQGIQTIIKLNKIFTDIQIVTEYTDKQMYNLNNTMTELAKSTGATLDEVASGSVEWFD